MTMSTSATAEIRLLRGLPMNVKFLAIISFSLNNVAIKSPEEKNVEKNNVELGT